MSESTTIDRLADKRPKTNNKEEWKTFRGHLRYLITRWSNNVKQRSYKIEVNLENVKYLGELMDDVMEYYGVEPEDSHYSTLIGQMVDYFTPEESVNQSVYEPLPVYGPHPEPVYNMPNHQPAPGRNRVNMEPFDGNPAHYPQFEKTFELLYESNYNYTDAEKFVQYKRLVGETGKKYLASLWPTEEGLAEAKRRIKELCNKPDEVRRRILDRIERMPAITKRERTNQISDFILDVESDIKALTSVNSGTVYINEIYFRAVAKKLPVDLMDKYATKCAAEQKNGSTADFVIYARAENRRYAQVLEVCRQPSSSNSQSARVHAITTRAPAEVKCAICDQAHRTFQCRSETPIKRREIAIRKKLCFRCLKPGHHIGACTSNFRCRCGGDHSSVLCKNNGQRPTSAPPRIESPSNPTTRSNSGQINNNQGMPILQAGILGQRNTIPRTNQPRKETPRTMATWVLNLPDDPPPVPECVDIKAIVSEDRKLEECNQVIVKADQLTTFYQTVLVSINGHVARVLLDSAAGRSVILHEFAAKIGLETIDHKPLHIKGAFDNTKQNATCRVRAVLKSMADGQSELEVVFNAIPSLGELNMAALSNEDQNTLNVHGFDIGDVDNISTANYPVKAILGVEYYSKIWCSMEEPIGPNLYVRRSIFGCVVTGVSPLNHGNDNESGLFNVVTTEPRAIPKAVAKPANFNERVELEYMEEFNANMVAYNGQRYSVKLPWIQPVDLKDNRKVAWLRFSRLLKHLETRNLTKQYSEAIQEMIDNFAEKAPQHGIRGKTYYFPHHCVLRLDKATTQIRIVFDGSAKAPNAKSLNENLFKGVNFWDSYALLIKFRYGEVGMIADIEKAFLMIEVDLQDRDALRFWWLDSAGQPTEYRLRVVPFGSSASPFLLAAVLNCHLNKFRERFPDVVPQIESNLYVDDLVKAFPAIATTELVQFKGRTEELFQHAGMNIRKWRSNLEEIDRLWAPEGKDTTKVLGHLWNLKTDRLSLNVDIDRLLQMTTLTLRTLSSFVASVYDPLGLVTPYTVLLKLFKNRLWSLKLKWDDPVPAELEPEATRLMNEVFHVNDASIPRNVIFNKSPGELMVFSDASPRALGVVAYCRSNGQTNFLLSKSKLSREATIPELELDALLLAAKTAATISKTYEFQSITIFCDSLINLQRLQKHPNEQKSAVALRIAKLKSLVSANYRHVTSEDNIADLITRGCTMTELLVYDRWWNGPPIAETTRFEATNLLPIQEVTADEAERKNDCECIRTNKYSRALGSFRCIANYLKRKKPDNYQDIEAHQLALILMIKFCQRTHFKNEIAEIEDGKCVPKDSVLRNYNCIIDGQGVLRLRTRLEKASNLSYDQIYPVIMPANCNISRAIVEYEHVRLAHPGIDRTINAVRDRYFVIGLRGIAKGVRRNCRICKWLRAATQDATYGALPAFRLDMASPPFTNTGLDIFGPLKISMKTPGKRYGLIFTCATTRAVHLELMQNMTAHEVFQAMRKFFARRGIPHLIYSDNGKQLTAVRSRLQQFLQELRTANPNVELRLTWHLQTAASPWRGGFYERLIRTIKEALVALTFKRVINDDELVITLYEIEGRMNSRPLFNYEGAVITPADFFVGKSLLRLPPIGNNNANQVTRVDIIDEYIKSQRSQNAVWTAWRQQYLLQLRNFHQNVYLPHSPVQFKVGDVVILKNNTQIDSWPLGIITQLYPGDDGVVRTVDVRTTSYGHVETKKRSIQTLVPLEASQEVSSLPDA